MNKIKSSGFTIVELLIVIVVIGILAAITIVVYNGIQDRAARTQTVSAVSAYMKGLSLYSGDNGSYPVYQNACLGGTNIPNSRCYQVSDGTSTCTGAGAAYTQTAFDNVIKPYMGNNLPAPSTQSVNCGGAQFAGGLYYGASTGKNASLYITYKAAVGTCPTVGGVNVVVDKAQDALIICRYDLPTLP